jgi:nitroimidazol reductase NimA-like FMN-containing flavoprotein (pyridoxamine 5'-phosphate oxidase superfamily)
MTKILNEIEARSLIAAGKIGRLGCVDNGEPYVVPVNYVFEDMSIYSHSLPGRKIEALRAHPRACLQVDEIRDDFNWRSVIAYGKFEEIRVPTDRRTILRKLLERFPLLTPVESLIAEDAGAPDSVVFRIVVDRISGIAEGGDLFALITNSGVTEILCDEMN